MASDFFTTCDACGKPARAAGSAVVCGFCGRVVTARAAATGRRTPEPRRYDRMTLDDLRAEHSALVRRLEALDAAIRRPVWPARRFFLRGTAIVVAAAAAIALGLTLVFRLHGGVHVPYITVYVTLFLSFGLVTVSLVTLALFDSGTPLKDVYRNQRTETERELELLDAAIEAAERGAG